MKSLFTFLIVISLFTFSCTNSFNLNKHYNDSLPFHIIDQQHPNGLRESDITVNDPKHIQLISWLSSNKNGWKKTDHNTHAGLIIVSQGDFRILFYRDNDFIVLGYNDAKNETQQYMRKMDSNELRFLLQE